MGTFLDCGCGCDGRRQEQKFLLAFIYTVLFLVLSSPYACQVTSKLFGVSGGKQLILHGVFFLFAVWTTLNIKNELMVGAITPFPPSQPEGPAPNSTELPDEPPMEQPWADPDGTQAIDYSMDQPYTNKLDSGPAPPNPPPTQNFLPSPIAPAFAIASKKVTGFQDVDKQNGIIYAVI
jgi:hypothetical protein